MYEIHFGTKAQKQFKNIDKNTQEIIVKHLKLIVVNPKHYLKKLYKIKLYKLRIGNYRILIDILEKEKVLLVFKIGHRRNIYKNLK